MKLPLLAVLVLLSASNAIGQKKEGQNRMYLSFTPQYCLHKLNVEQDGKGYDPIVARNTFAYNVGIEYERKTRYGLLINAAVRYGRSNHDVKSVIDLSTFDPEAKQMLNGFIFSNRYNASYNYMSPRLMIGYQFFPKKAWPITARYGFSVKKFIGGEHMISQIAIMTYADDDGKSVKTSGFFAHAYNFGEEGREWNDRGWKRGYASHELYIGVEHNFPHKWPRSISVGLEGTLSPMSTKNNSGLLSVGASRTWGDGVNPHIKTDFYYDRNITLGLRIAVGLWP